MPDKPWCSPALGIQQAAALFQTKTCAKNGFFSMSIDYQEEINALVMKKALVWISNRNRSPDEFIRIGRNSQREVVWFGLDLSIGTHYRPWTLNCRGFPKFYIVRIENHWFGQETTVTFFGESMNFQAFSELSGPSRVFRVNGQVLLNWTLISLGRTAL